MRDPLHIERSSSTTRHTPPQHHHHHHHQGPVRPHERRHAETGGSATTPPRATTTHSPAWSIINHIDAPAAPAAPPTDISLGRAAPPQHRIASARPSNHPPSCSRRHRPRIYRPFRAVHLCTKRMTHVNNFFLPTIADAGGGVMWRLAYTTWSSLVAFLRVGTNSAGFGELLLTRSSAVI
ncbi:uncharacterized protein LOC143913041 [Arctopsyche grandis]|uniref:uncharacterized protein LOC143913041 n=1 Tax=Arctopsyche grandis TaxID=121162 RepID=UPI00406D8703